MALREAEREVSGADSSICDEVGTMHPAFLAFIGQMRHKPLNWKGALFRPGAKTFPDDFCKKFCANFREI